MSQDNIPQTSEMVPSGALDPMSGSMPASYYGQESTMSGRAKPIIDSIELLKVTPQILILLIISGLKRNWKWALPSGTVIALVAFAAIYVSFPVRYEATAYMQILSQKPYFIFDEKLQQQYDAYVTTQFAIIRSPLILDKALENSDVANLPYVLKQKNKVEWLAKALKLRQTQNKSELVTIGIETEVAEDAEKIVNSVVTAFFDTFASQAQDWNHKLLTQLNLELNRQKATARLLQDEIRSNMEKAAKQGGVASKEGMSGGLNQGESILRDLYLQESKLESLRAEEKMLKESMTEGMNIPQSILAKAIENDPMLRMLQTRLVDLREQVASLKKTLVRDDDPKIIGYQNQIKEIEKKIEEEYSSAGSNKVKDLQSSFVANLEQAIWEQSRAIRAQEILVESLRKRYGEQVTNVGERTVQIVDVSFQQNQLERVNKILDQLETRVVSLETERFAPNQIELKKKATIPTKPNNAKQLLFASVGALGCFCFPLFLGIAIERLKPRLYHVSQIRRAIPQVILGEIMEPPVAWIHGATFRKRLARYRESVHNWCTHLLLSDPFRNCRTLAVASVAGDDGKTFLAVQVAVAMAQMKSGPVLLIDADMRVGRLHLLFGNEETGIGLADVLSFRNGFGEAVVLNEREPNLHLLSAGQLDVSPYELLGDGRFRELLDTLESHYSLILVVLPPVANAAESLIMASSTDSVLLCVRQGETILGAMEDVYRKLVSTGSFVDGIVVKDIPYYQMAGKDGGFADKLEQIRLAHLLQYTD
ncbi:MAG: AAA family ATPase [Planctomycetaceae bacterium]|jgi:capsular exopolysaccharide synthesis family protein|nr:AAA family ATPase [Planctomycetaceae bacterium]